MKKLLEQRDKLWESALQAQGTGIVFFKGESPENLEYEKTRERTRLLLELTKNKSRKNDATFIHDLQAKFDETETAFIAIENLIAKAKEEKKPEGLYIKENIEAEKKRLVENQSKKRK